MRLKLIRINIRPLWGTLRQFARAGPGACAVDTGGGLEPPPVQATTCYLGDPALGHFGGNAPEPMLGAMSACPGSLDKPALDGYL